MPNSQWGDTGSRLCRRRATSLKITIFCSVSGRAPPVPLCTGRSHMYGRNLFVGILAAGCFATAFVAVSYNIWDGVRKFHKGRIMTLAFVTLVGTVSHSLAPWLRLSFSGAVAPISLWGTPIPSLSLSLSSRPLFVTPKYSENIVFIGKHH
jgi:hypothetical protein